MTDAVGLEISGVRPGVHLNAAGREQAERLAAALRDVHLDALVSSPLERAMETATPIARSHGCDIEQDPAFLEFDFGEWTGERFRDLDASSADWRRFNTIRSVCEAPGGESMLDVQRRAVRALLGWQNRFSSGTIAIVTHGDVLRAILLHVLGAPLDMLHRIEVSPARFSVILLSEHEPRVLQVNGDSLPPLA